MSDWSMISNEPDDILNESSPTPSEDGFQFIKERIGTKTASATPAQARSSKSQATVDQWLSNQIAIKPILTINESDATKTPLTAKSAPNTFIFFLQVRLCEKSSTRFGSGFFTMLDHPSNWSDNVFGSSQNPTIFKDVKVTPLSRFKQNIKAIGIIHGGQGLMYIALWCLLYRPDTEDSWFWERMEREVLEMLKSKEQGYLVHIQGELDLVTQMLKRRSMLVKASSVIQRLDDVYSEAYFAIEVGQGLRWMSHGEGKRRYAEASERPKKLLVL
ncbi:hypothetical protein EG329_000980 [Mollisiaceae sp. DMI_Dod_QoI]|nr:hypothetical protein EG329_000980 [Helotiales sp. DMI_Dod_QoI]